VIFDRARSLALILLVSTLALSGCGEKKYELTDALPEHTDHSFYDAYCDVHIAHIGAWTYKGDQPVWGEISSLNEYDRKIVEKMSQVANVYYPVRESLADITSPFDDEFLKTVRIYLAMADYIEKNSESYDAASSYLRNLQMNADYEVRNSCVMVQVDSKVTEAKKNLQYNIENIELKYLEYINS